jgi:hypothetical protein
MRAEKVVLSFVAVLVGLIAAGIAFYLYQATRTVPASQTKPLAVAPTPTATQPTDEEHLLQIDNPKDESVSDKKLITISGKTVKGSTIVITTEDGDQVVKPADNGNFTTTQSIPDGTSLLYITAIFPDGSEKKETRTVTFSTESF